MRAVVRSAQGVKVRIIKDRRVGCGAARHFTRRCCVAKMELGNQFQLAPLVALIFNSTPDGGHASQVS
jgi:hypothetical protein